MPGLQPGAPGTGAPTAPPAPVRYGSGHPLVAETENARLRDYEQRVKASFDNIVPVLKRISALQHEEDFAPRAQAMAREALGFELPEAVLENTWVEPLDMRRLFAACVFETYHRFCDDFFRSDPLGFDPREEAAFEQFLQDCGFHILDISPCADGRLAHLVRYVLRLPHRAVRRKSYAGAMFDVDDSIQKWVETEMLRYREGRPNTADAPTRYLKVVAYHFSEIDPDHGGCAAHGSDALKAATAGLDRLYAFQQAIENSFCCGASIDLLLIGVNTDNDAIRVHVPDGSGRMDVGRFLDVEALYEATRGTAQQTARDQLMAAIRETSPDVAEGMARLIERLVSGNLSQIDYVRRYEGGSYPDVDHAERFIGAGIGFEEIQLRNLTYFAYLRTVEEAATDVDVGIKIFRKLNVSRGLPVPVVVRFDYHGQVPGARDRAIEHCGRVADALHRRFEGLSRQGLLHTMQVVRDCGAGGLIEVLKRSIDEPAGACGSST